MSQAKPEVDPQELARFAARISEHLQELEASVDQWREYRNDYQQLGHLLSTLPEKTSYDIMVPLGKLAFMPGRIVHTNEVLALLGDNWFADVSAKHAAEIVSRRQEVVEENLKIVETQLNETNARAGATPGVFKAEQYGLNEQGLPFMEIREELPSDDDQDNNAPVNIPSSIDAARKLQMAQKSKAEKLADQALLEKLKALELEEDGDVSDKDEPVEDDVDDDELSDEYDTEIAENLFDQFDDDEEYGMDGVVDKEDYSYHEFEQEEEQEEEQEQEQQEEQEGEREQEIMETITTPSVQIAIDQQAAAATTSPVPTSAPTSEAPLGDIVKERTDEPIQTTPKDRKGKSKVTPIIRPRVSRFKKSIQEQQQQEAPAHEEKSPKKVSWGPDVVHESTEDQLPQEPVFNIRSPADIYHQLLDQRIAEQANQDEMMTNEVMDIQSLLKDAPVMKETIYMPSDIPQVTASPKKKVSRFRQQREQDRSTSEESNDIPRRNKLDTSIMKGAVIEKETENVDLDEVEENMLEKEVAAEYQRKRQNFIASQGGLSFTNKPEFEVYDDDLPLPSNQAKEPEEKPKKVSKFRAAKLAAKTDQLD